MARCESIDVLRKIILDTKIEEMENSEVDSDSDSSCLYVDTRGEKESNPDSPKYETVHAGPVLSLKCLHDDDTDEGNTSSGYCTETISESQDTAVPGISTNSFHEDNDCKDLNHEPEDNEEHPDLVPVKIIAVNGSSNVIVTPDALSHSSVPARNDWTGAYNFRIKIQCANIPKKSENPVYSESLNKLYIAKDHPFKVLVSAENVPVDSKVKVTAVFSLVEHAYEIVQRCPTHTQQDFSKGNSAYEHFVQCFSESAVYEKNVNGEYSVTVPYVKPREGERYTTYLFKLTCFSSCSGGINRRPFMLIFSLEKDDIPLGRQTLEAKVCACPLRDFKLEEQKEHRRNYRTNNTTNSVESLLPSSPQKNNSKYSIVVTDREEYLFLKHMKALYESASAVKVLSDT